MEKPKYLIERWEFGWVLCAPEGMPGIPMDSLQDCGALFDPQDAFMDSGIAHHLRVSGKSKANVCIVTNDEGKRWRERIAEENATLPPEWRWWWGTDVGNSSATIFSVLCKNRPYNTEAAEQGKGSIPHDSDDFGRCKRLLDAFPEWRKELPKVAEAYPNTLWPQLIDQWNEIEAASPKDQTRIIKEIEEKSRG